MKKIFFRTKRVVKFRKREEKKTISKYAPYNFKFAKYLPPVSSEFRRRVLGSCVSECVCRRRRVRGPACQRPWSSAGASRECERSPSRLSSFITGSARTSPPKGAVNRRFRRRHRAAGAFAGDDSARVRVSMATATLRRRPRLGRLRRRRLRLLVRRRQPAKY